MGRINEFGDLTNQEFTAKYLGYIPRSNQNEIMETADIKDVPDSVDWTTKDVVTPVKNQGSCGSCWAFSTTGSLESAYAIKNKKLVSLSEQQLVDCSKKNQGCGGGLMDLAFAYIKTNGIESEADYKYTGTNGSCKFDKTKVVTSLTSF